MTVQMGSRMKTLAENSKDGCLKIKLIEILTSEDAKAGVVGFSLFTFLSLNMTPGNSSSSKVPSSNASSIVYKQTSSSSNSLSKLSIKSPLAVANCK